MSLIQCNKCRLYFGYEDLDSDLICNDCKLSEIANTVQCKCGNRMKKERAQLIGFCQKCHDNWLEEDKDIEEDCISGYLRPV